MRTATPPLTADRAGVRRRLLLGGWAGVLAPVLYVGTWVVAGAVRDGYDPVAQAISELAAVGAPGRWAMTLAFAAFGLLALPFADALRLVLPGDARPIAAVVVACGAATVAAGALPCTEGCPGPVASPTDLGHAAAATVGYAALVGAPLLTAWHLRAAGPAWRRFARWSLVAGLVSALALGLWALGLFGAAGGAAQRGFNTLADVWWAGAGVVVLRRARGIAPPDAG